MEVRRERGGIEVFFSDFLAEDVFDGTGGGTPIGGDAEDTEEEPEEWGGMHEGETDADGSEESRFKEEVKDIIEIEAPTRRCVGHAGEATIGEVKDIARIPEASAQEPREGASGGVVSVEKPSSENSQRGRENPAEPCDERDGIGGEPEGVCKPSEWEGETAGDDFRDESGLIGFDGLLIRKRGTHEIEERRAAMVWASSRSFGVSTSVHGRPSVEQA